MLHIIIVSTLIYILYKYYDKSPSIEFIKPDDFKNEIPYMKYFQRMSKYDLYARHSPTRIEYIKKYINNIVEYNISDKKILLNLIAKADKILKKYNIYSIPWKFIKVNTLIESSYPHTLNNVIVFNDNYLYNKSPEEQLLLLIHEKIHLYQKYQRIGSKKLIQLWGFTPTDLTHPLLRNNPDTDMRIWALHDTPIFLLYNGIYPLGIHDVVCVDANNEDIDQSQFGLSPSIIQMDHPYEVMAYELATILTGGPASPGLKNTKTWMDKNL
jgi:hypothetical protein